MRRLKRLGLAAAVAAALATTAGAGTASAAVVADQYPATLYTSTAQMTWQVPSGAGAFCNEGGFEATLHTGAAPGFAGTPTGVSDCGNNGINMNGCQFEFQPSTDSVKIGPSGCGPITKGIWEGCLASIPSQTLPAVYKNIGSGTGSALEVTVAAQNVKYTTSKWSLACGEAGAHENLKWTIRWVVAAKNASKQPIGFRAVESGEQEGFFMSGQNFGPESPRFNAEIFPIRVTAERGATESDLTLLAAGGAAATCKSVGRKELWGDSVELAFDEYAGCTFLEEPATVKANSCRYAFNAKERAGESSPLFYGSTKIACSKAGDTLEIVTSACTLKVPAQSFSGLAEFENQGQRGSAVVDIDATASGVSFSKSGPLCFLVPGTTGSFAAHVTARATFIGIE